MDYTTFLTRENGETDQFIGSLRRLYTFDIPPDGRMDLLRNAGVDDELLGRINNSAAPNDYVTRLIAELMHYRYTYRRRGYHPVERLLQYLTKHYRQALGDELDFLLAILDRCTRNLKALRIRDSLGCIIGPARQPIGSGILIRPNLLLTCYHNFLKVDPLSEAFVRFGYYEENTPGPEIPLAFSYNKLSQRPEFMLFDPDLNLALVGLRQPIAGRELSKEDLSPQVPVVDLPIHLFHHPAGRPVRIDTGTIKELRPLTGHLYHTAPGSACSPGGPVAFEDTDRWKVIALHCGSDRSGPPPQGTLSGLLLGRVWPQIEGHL